MGLSESFKVIIDVVTEGAQKSLKDLKKEVANADGVMGKFKAAGGGAMDYVQDHAAAFALSVIFFFYVISPWLQQSSILSRSSSYLGRISYSVYLFHILFAQVLDKKLAALPMGLQLAIYLSAVAVFCTAFYYFFERPILAARPRYRSAHEPLPEPDAADRGNNDGRLVAAGSQ